jgi:hypothetical protein
MQPDEPQAKREFSLGTLFSDLTREFSTLVRQEAQLIKTEVWEKVSDAKTGVGQLAIGAIVLLGGFLVLLLAVVAGLNQLLGTTADDYPWLSPLIVGGLAAIVGIGLILRGRRNLEAETLAPRRSGESLKRDTEVLKEQFNK